MSSSFFSDLDSRSTESPEQNSESSFFSDLPSRARSLLSALPKGLLKGAQNFNPLPSFGPVPKELGSRLTEQFLPTQEGLPEDILQFTGENAPIAAMGAGGLVRKGLQAVAGGLAKKGAKELNLPEWAQDLIGGAGMIGPDLAKRGLSKSLTAAPSQQEMVNFLKSKGMSDKSITPIIQNPKKLAALSKAAFKFSKKSPFVQGIRKEAGKILEDIRSAGDNEKYLSGKNLDSFMDDFTESISKIPKRHSRLVKQEVEDLMNNPINFASLRDFDVAVNDVIKGATGGKASIGRLKGPIDKAMHNVDEKLFKELKLGKQAYSKISEFSEKMTKKNWEFLLKLGAAGGFITKALLYGGSLKAPIAGAGVQYAARKALTSPRLQNIHRKLMTAVLENNKSQALRLAEMFNKDLDESSQKS